jgi:outer membrane protein TolC
VAKTRGDIETADAQLKAAQAKRDDLAARVDQEVREALLDIASSAKLVEAAKSNAGLADEALSEAQERYKAGVADNLAVSEAQTTDEQASDAYIGALYRHNMAKLSLARAMGGAATNYKDYFGGKQP